MYINTSQPDIDRPKNHIQTKIVDTNIYAHTYVYIHTKKSIINTQIQNKQIECIKIQTISYEYTCKARSINNLNRFHTCLKRS